MKQYNMLEQAPISVADFNALAVATVKVLNSYEIKEREGKSTRGFLRNSHAEYIYGVAEVYKAWEFCNSSDGSVHLLCEFTCDAERMKV